MSQPPISASYFPVAIDAIESDDLGFDLYLVYERSAVLYRSSGAGYDLSDCAQLREKGITHFYVPNTQHQKFQQAIVAQMSDSFEDRSITVAKRAQIVRDSCGKMIEDFTSNPNIPGLSETLGTMAGKFTQWCEADESEFSYLLDMSEHDYYTTTHMVNVGVGCTLLAAELLGSEHPLVQKLSLGGLIHDVGKAGVPAEVLNKEGKLTDEEWVMIRKHPQMGADILRSHEGFDELMVDMTLNHHERLDGKGYPNGISGEEISLPARICAVVDVYDALCTARPYRGPIPPRAVLDMMREDVGKAFDAKVFGAWEKIVHRLIASDPERAVADNGDPVTMKLDAVIPSMVAQNRPEFGFMTVRRSDGSTGSLAVVETTLGEVILGGDMALRPGERVTLCQERGDELSSSFVSTRFGSRGDKQLVFKLHGKHGLVA